MAHMDILDLLIKKFLLNTQVMNEASVMKTVYILQSVYQAISSINNLEF